MTFKDLTGHKKAEQEVIQVKEQLAQPAADKYRTLFNSLDEGYILADVIFDENNQPIDLEYIDANPAAVRMAGVELVGQQTPKLDPNDEAYWYEAFARVAKTGVGERHEFYSTPQQAWYKFYVFKVGEPGSSQVAAIYQDITERKRHEANIAFLADVADALSNLSTADEIMQVVGAKIGAFMKVPYCYFMSIDEERDEVVLLDRWNAEEVPRLPDTLCLSEQVSTEFYKRVHAGETIVSNNTQTNPITNAQANASIEARSFITVPFHHHGEWKYQFSVHDISPRNWRQDEIELVRELANRIFPRLERARAEDALRRSEAKYRSLFNSIDEGFCIVQVIFDQEQKPIDYLYLEINPVFEEQTGLKNALGKMVRELVPNLEPFWFEIYGTVALTGEPTRFVNHAQSMGRWFDVYAFRIGEPHERKVAILFNDISARKQTEETLQEAHHTLRQQAEQLEQANETLQTTLEELQTTEEELRKQNEKLGTARELAELERQRYQDLFNFAPDGYVVTDAQGIIQEANQAIAVFIEIDPQYLVNTPLAVYISELDRRGFRDLLYNLHQQSGFQKWQSDELSLQHPSGHLIPVAVTGSAIFNAQAQIVGVRWLIQDITERKQTEAEREQLLKQEQAARAEAERANRIKDEFLSILSHELRSPLNPILGWSRLLQTRKMDDAKVAQALATIERNARLQTQLIDDLLDVARILRGKLSLNQVPVDLMSVIEAAIEVVRTAATARSISLVTELTDIGQVRGDNGRLQQIVWNLLSNAIKFTPTGGRVNIRLDQVDNYAQVTITDTGRGITPKFLPYIFESFRQEDTSITRQYGGLGLGLSIVKYLVDAHGGTITADSLGEGQGATFTVKLPLLNDELMFPVNEPLPSVDIDLAGVRVLAVDDSEDTRALLSVLLSQYGAEVSVVDSGAEVLAALKSYDPDVLVCDIGIPNMDGYNLLQQIRVLSSELGGDIPAIAVTAFATQEDYQRALDSGFQKHIAKPIEPEILVSAIAELTQN